MPEQPKYLERAKDTYRFYRSKRLSDDRWTIAKTAKALRRSIGSISEDLMIVKWLRTHDGDLEKFDYANEAIKFIREKQKEQDLEELD